MVPNTEGKMAATLINRWISLLLYLTLPLFVRTLSCPNIHFRLRSSFTLQKGILCSAELEDISIPNKAAKLLARDGTIGIYKRNNFTAQICYWKVVESGLIFLNNLTGGIFYAIGK